MAIGGLALLLALLGASSTNGLYFYVTDGSQRCFIEEVPPETLIVGVYKSPDFKPYGDPEFSGSVRSRNITVWCMI